MKNIVSVHLWIQTVQYLSPSRELTFTSLETGLPLTAERTTRLCPGSGCLWSFSGLAGTMTGWLLDQSCPDVSDYTGITPGESCDMDQED